MLPKNGDGILGQPDLAVFVANFLAHLARVLATSAARLPLAAIALVPLTLFGCSGLPSLNSDPTVSPDTPVPVGLADPLERPDPTAGAPRDLSVDRIAYIGPYGDLFTVNPDGSGERRLTG